MKANSFEIKEISIHVNRNDVCLTGSALHGVMHYPTVLYIDYSQLNRVLGLLQNMNPQSEITENFERNFDSDGNEFMFLSTINVKNRVIPFFALEREKTVLKIRA